MCSSPRFQPFSGGVLRGGISVGARMSALGRHASLVGAIVSISVFSCGGLHEAGGGVPSVDGGASGSDIGQAISDAGRSIADAGSITTDAGSSKADSVPAHSDAGSAHSDAGPAPSDGAVDAGGAGPDGYAKTSEGFYKELFMDTGVGLDDFDRLPAADQLKFRWEFYSGENTTEQRSYMTSNANDSNGVLLYPDREPRFMILYTGGGYGDHAGPVGDQGIKNIRDFFYNGGSYTGTCNGNYLAWSWGYNFWPGKMNVDRFEGTVNGTIPENSPILRYYDFGGDHLIKGLSHYSGGYATGALPAGTEVLLIGKSAGTQIDGDGHPTGWAYKPKATSGRMCGLSDHPEYASQAGEVMSYLSAAYHYAYDGVAEPDVKASLVNGVERVMNKSSEENDPAHTKIGDKQYHHFTVSLPSGASELVATVAADDRYQMNLYIAQNGFALASRAKYREISTGGHKSLAVSSPGSGTWYIGVECATTVVATKGKTGYVYSGNLEVLNGVEYSIKVAWK